MRSYVIPYYIKGVSLRDEATTVVVTSVVMLAFTSVVVVMAVLFDAVL